MIEDTILFLLLSIAWFKIIVTTHAIIYRYSSIAGCYMQQVKDVCVRSCMPARPLVNIHRRVVSVDVRGFAKGGNRWLSLVPTPIACPTPRRWCQILARQLPLLLCLGHLCQRMQHQALRIWRHLGCHLDMSCHQALFCHLGMRFPQAMRCPLWLLLRYPVCHRRFPHHPLHLRFSRHHLNQPPNADAGVCWPQF
jgi:hypothetical protein